MHDKIIQYLKDKKDELKASCNQCKNRGCKVCSKEFDLYEQMAHSEIPLKYFDFDLSDLPDNDPAIKKVKKYINKIDEAYKQGYGIFLYGKNGTGKTLCACLIGKELLKKGYKVRFTFLNEVISAFSDSMYDKDLRQKLKDDILKIDVLILDDIDKAALSDSKYISSILDTLFRQRTQNCLPTIITANKTIDEILSQQGEVYAKSLVSLFDESLEPIVFLGSDKRKDIKLEMRKQIFE